MNIKSFVLNRYFLVFSTIYLISFFYLVGLRNYGVTELVFTLVFVAIIPVILASFLFKDKPAEIDGSLTQAEKILLLICLLPMMAFIALGTDKITFHRIADVRLKEIAKVIIKLIAFTLIPYLLFKWFDGKGFKELFPLHWKRSWLIPVIILMIYFQLFQVFFGNGFKRLQEHHFSVSTLLFGGVLAFVWQVIEAGVVEEFFFRGILQTFLQRWLKSATGAILFSALIFGLVHAPGLYLRPELSADILGEGATFFGICCYTVCINAVIGIFFGYLFWKTKSLLPGVVIHAAVDLLPGLGDFIQTWISK